MINVIWYNVFKKEKIMDSYSWKIINSDIAIKKTDCSVYKYHGTGIPKDTKWFWNIEDMQKGERRDISLIYNDKKYKAYIKIESSNTMRARMFWSSGLIRDLGGVHNYLNNIDEFPEMRFERYGNDQYKIELLNIQDKEENLDNESCVIINTMEGNKKLYYTSKYERSPQNRRAAIKIHGLKCNVCGFDYEKVYGEIGKGYIEVHHKKPLYSLDEAVLIDVKEDLTTLCANCHRMIHRHKNKVLSVEELKEILCIN